MNKQATLTDDAINSIIGNAIRHTTATKEGTFHAISNDIGMTFIQPIILAASESRTKQMEMAYKIANQCATADQDHANTRTSLQVDLTAPYRATIVIREF